MEDPLLQMVLGGERLGSVDQTQGDPLQAHSGRGHGQYDWTSRFFPAVAGDHSTAETGVKYLCSVGVTDLGEGSWGMIRRRASQRPLGGGGGGGVSG